jgi:WD repeat-containing protein 35
LTIFPSASKVSIPNLNDVRIFGSTIAVAVRSGDSFDIQLLSLSGFLLERRRLMEFPELTGFTFDGTTVALASRSIIQRWNILTKELSYIQINDLNLANKGLAPDEFHRTVEDSILDICFSADGALAVARESGLIHILVSGKLEKTISLMTRPEKIFLNCDASLVAIIDMENKLHIADTETFTSSLTTRDECWDAVWADDDPLMLACMDKSRLYVLRGASGKPEEPLLLNGNVLMGIGNLEIVTISDALRKVEQFPTKSLRDFKQVLEAATQLEDSYDFVHRAPHPRLWYLLAEHALLLEPARLDIAVRAYDQCNCIDGKEAVGYFASIPDPVEQRMEILFMLGRQKECEELTAIRGREDLWLRAKKRVGDFESISKSAKWNTVASPREIAEYLYGAMKFDQALEWFRKTDDLSPNYLRALLLTNKFEELVHVSESLNLDKATLTNVARILGMTGLCKPSANFFARAGDVGAAFKVCADWHRWDLIQALENQHGRHYDKRDASRLVKTGQYIQAVEVIRYGGDKNVLKPILQKLYGIFLDWRTRKMLAVINGVELDTWRRAEAIHFLVMGQAAIYASKFSQAVQILKKLSGLMDVFTPGERIEAFKLQALAGLFNRDRSFCSNAITKLEVFRGDHQYKDLALALFSKSWTDVTISAYPNAGPVEESAMDMARDRSISGAPLVLEVRDASFRCKRCSCTVDGKIPSNLCPICHTVI